MHYISGKMMRIKLKMQTLLIHDYWNTFNQNLVLSFEIESLDSPDLRIQEIFVLDCLIFGW